MNIDEIGDFLSEIARYRPYLTITGAEPFIRKDASEILRLIHIAGVNISSILTNGTLLTEDNVRSIIETKVSMVQISIDGNREIHDELRGVKGCYQKAVDGIKLLKEIKQQLKSTTPNIRINCVITSKNLERLDSLVELAQYLGVELQYQHLMWLDKKTIDMQVRFMKEEFGFEDKTTRNLENNLQGFDTKFLCHQINIIKNECSRRAIPLYFLQFSDSLTSQKWYKDLSFTIRTHCLEPFLVARVSADGEVKFCPLIDYSCGNIRDDQFSTVWKNDRAHKIRSELRKNGLFPGCARCCKL